MGTPVLSLCTVYTYFGPSPSKVLYSLDQPSPVLVYPSFLHLSIFILNCIVEVVDLYQIHLTIWS